MNIDLVPILLLVVGFVGIAVFVAHCIKMMHIFKKKAIDEVGMFLRVVCSGAIAIFSIVFVMLFIVSVMDK